MLTSKERADLRAKANGLEPNSPDINDCCKKIAAALERILEYNKFSILYDIQLAQIMELDVESGIRLVRSISFHSLLPRNPS